MTKSFSFVVPGEPIGQGSMKHIGNGRMIAANDKKLRPWRKAVKEAIESKWAADGEIIKFDGPTGIRIEFCVERPKSVKREWPTVPYDIDKSCRSILDSCTDSTIVTDDSIFVELYAKKVYGDGCPYGAHVTIYEV